MNKIIVFDIDDTLLKADDKDIAVWKEVGGKRIRLTTSQLALDPDSVNPAIKFDYSEFRNPTKVHNSIVNGKPIRKNLNKLKEYSNKGYAVSFLTARGLEDVVYTSLNEFLVKNGINVTLIRKHCHAVNDETKSYRNVSTPERKADILKELCSSYSEVRFVDDDIKNVQAANELGLSNLIAIEGK